MNSHSTPEGVRSTCKHHRLLFRERSVSSVFAIEAIAVKQTVNCRHIRYPRSTNHMVTTRRHNRKAVVLLVALFLLVGLHFLLYTKEQEHMEILYHNTYWERMLYGVILLAIVGEIGLLASNNILVKATSFLFTIPNGVFSLFLLQSAQLDGQAHLLPIKSYYDYLILVSIIASALTGIMLIYIVFLSFFKQYRSLVNE